MFKFLAVLALFAAVTSAGALPRQLANNLPITSRLNGKIINGRETTIEEVPHQVSLQVFGRHFCGGSIISKHWILTAAHCTGNSPSHYTVLAGTAHNHEGGSVHQVDKIIPHAGFGRNENNIIVNDIAVAHVVKPFQFDDTRKPVALYAQDEETQVGATSIITGWGFTKNGLPDILNLVQVPIISKEKCYKLYNYYGGISVGQICAAYEEGGKDACQGDSGGPLTVEGRLAGVVSWGIGCAEPGNPGVYTEVAYYRDWIKSNTGV